MKPTKQIIGFASQFYTLWDYRVETNYITDSNGKHWPSYTTTYYTYTKNISKSLSKVMELYPDINIDEGLRGRARSFKIKNTEVDLSPELIKFGKYYGKTIQEISEMDFGYILWLRDNVNSSETRELINKLPLVVEYDEKKEREIRERFDVVRKSFLTPGKHTVFFERNPRNRMYELNQSYHMKWVDSNWKDVIKPDSLVGDVFINDVKYVLVFQGYKEVYGMYPYIMPMIDGKCRRVKGKSVDVEVIPLGYTFFSSDKEPEFQVLLVR